MNFLSTLFPKLIDLILPREFLVKKLEKMTSEEFLESVSISKSPEGLFFYQEDSTILMESSLILLIFGE